MSALGEHRQSRGSLPLWLDFLTRPVKASHEDVRLEIMSTLLLSRSTVLFGAISLCVLLGAIAVLQDIFAAVFTGSVFLVAGIARLLIITSLKGKMLAWPQVARIVVSGLAYATAVGLVGSVAAWSGDPVLQVLGAMVMTGIVFGFCISNSGAPRYAEVQALIVTVPFLIGAALSGPPAMLLILLQTPFWLFGLHGLIRTTHRRLADLVQVQRQNEYLAYNDTLTGLANRAQVLSSLTQIARDRALKSPPPYVLFLDLDGFKAINDTHGHAVGDLLLRAVAQRLSECVRAGDVVGRIGGDEFVVILRDLDPDDITRLARRLTEAIARPFSLGTGITAKVGLSIGGAPLGPDPEQAMASADLMLYSAKRDGRGTFRLTGL
ncbi:GGDEF domain-containing protein [Devosia rhizoryzae]|uniref:GGDEF domain-containing protein n=1 Tax=Devosia rhizoryzae TaxID=2774137 RepID=A0ABX7CA09_9HYPH|nr:GGDEF domain-containing protein [Devosia rhizoryzae]QQR39430.1 GGDEF domain-containing protein [Devosia rhizoryzae]